MKDEGINDPFNPGLFFFSAAGIKKHRNTCDVCLMSAAQKNGVEGGMAPFNPTP